MIPWPLRMSPIGCPETSVKNYHYALHDVAEDFRSQCWVIYLIHAVQGYNSYSSPFLYISLIQSRTQFLPLPFIGVVQYTLKCRSHVIVSTRNPTTSTLSDKSIADMVKRDLDNISSHIQKGSTPSHSHVRAIFDDSVSSLAEKNEFFILYTGEKLGHLCDAQGKHSVFAWFNFREYSKEGSRSTQVLNSSAKVCQQHSAIHSTVAYVACR